jgi:predicted nucleotidyltransferase component of viral defense system
MLNEIGHTFTPLQAQHVDIMARISQEFSDTPMVLKGGTALLLCYGLDRYSEDLDFDSTTYINPEKKIKAAFSETKFLLHKIDNVKKTDSVRRWKIYYEGPAGNLPLKFEVSYRKERIPSNLVTNINGVQVYIKEELINQKLSAAKQRAKVRDLFDLSYLSNMFGHCFDEQQIKGLNELAGDVDILESRYKADHLEDSTLKGIDLEELVLELNQLAEELGESLNL